jgi:hypothetical protein
LAPAPGEAFPLVRIDPDRAMVEVQAVVSPMLTPDPRAPRFFLETICCGPDTREHETLFVTSAKPSHIHAALLSIGAQSGQPGGFRLRDGKPDPMDAQGDRLVLRVFVPSTGQELDPLEWIVNAKDQSRFPDVEAVSATRRGLPPPGWVFAGSRFVLRQGRSGYEADGTGVVIGLTTFGSEVIAWSRTFSPDSSIDPPEWIADFTRTLPAGTPVVLRLSKAQ